MFTAGPPLWKGASGGGGDPFYSQVVLLMHGDGINGSSVFTNEVYPARGSTMSTITPLNINISTTFPLFGTGCILFNGSGLYIGTDNPTSDYVPGTNDFTLECATNTASPGQTAAIIDFRSGALEQGPQFGMFGGQFFIFNTSGLFQSFGTVATGTYQRVAYSRVAGSGYCFVDGILKATVSDAVNYNNTGKNIFIGGVFSSTAFYTGRLDEIRVTNGTGRYATNYTPDVVAFPNF